jgi:DNA repair protein RecN (Recombination protein N)
MITQLSIRGLAIIEELHIEFSPQLNVITGETGAGKSILIKALHFLLGAKVDPDVIRRGFPRAHVSASFLLARNHACVELLDAHGIWHDEQELTELIIRREIAQKGRSQAWVNDQPITLSLLKELGGTLIDIYGQHENHRMLDPHTHLDYIDEFVSDQGLKAKVQSAMQQALQIMQELSAIPFR